MLELSDLELTKLCAKAMGIILCERHSHAWPFYFDPSIGEWGSDIRYDPLHDDAQAMALVKKLNLSIAEPRAGCPWGVYRHDALRRETSENPDLNRAIVMQAAK